MATITDVEVLEILRISERLFLKASPFGQNLDRRWRRRFAEIHSIWESRYRRLPPGRTKLDPRSEVLYQRTYAEWLDIHPRV